VVGIAGIEGNGQSELALILAGILKPKKGSILYKNEENKIFDLVKLNPNKISKLGISHVPEDRHKYGCILGETVETNLVLNQIDNKKFSNGFFLK
ncbi:ABC transporter ATP-binding protein, partial [bacterium]|nr:ABC transporter ATP-binding protein [bacterium]